MFDVIDENDDVAECECIEALDWDSLAHKLGVWFEDNEGAEVLQKNICLRRIVNRVKLNFNRFCT